MNKDEFSKTSFDFSEGKLKTDALASYDPRIFLIKVVAYGFETNALSDSHIDSINEEIAAISHILVRRRVRDFSSRSEIVNTLTDAFCLCSIGLEYGSAGDMSKAIRLLVANKMLKFFRIGNTLINKLHRNATAIKEKSILILPGGNLLQSYEEFELYNPLEKQFIASLLENRIIIDHADIEIEITIPPQPISTLTDLAIAQEMLDNLALRAEYMRLLPIDRINAEAIPYTEGSPSQQITQALIINIALRHQAEFYVEPEDMKNFYDICYDSKGGKVKDTTKDFLLGWIENYFEDKMLDFEDEGEYESVKRYAIEYWKYCIEKGALKG